MARNKAAVISNADLNAARAAKKDEFYTQYEDIEKEMKAYLEYNISVFRNKIVLCPCDDPEWSNFTKYFAVNFNRLGLKKLISTSFAEPRGRLLVLGRNDTDLDPDNLPFVRLKGNGDFRSEEITALLHESDIVVTNPPFSLFRSFLKWILDAEKQCIIIGNINSVTCKEVFPLIKDDLLWLGATIHSGDRKFYVPEDYPLNAAGCGIDDDGRRFIRVKGVRWYTNIEHGLRHRDLQLMSAAENLSSNKKLQKRLMKNYGRLEYPHYDDTEAIEIPITEAIPYDHKGVMGVPITFLDKYNPNQFEIIWLDGTDTAVWRGHGPELNGKALYRRIFIRRRNAE